MYQTNFLVIADKSFDEIRSQIFVTNMSFKKPWLT